MRKLQSFDQFRLISVAFTITTLISKAEFVFFLQLLLECLTRRILYWYQHLISSGTSSKQASVPYHIMYYVSASIRQRSLLALTFWTGTQTWSDVVAFLVDDSLVSGIGQRDLEAPGASGEVSVVEALHIQDQFNSSFDAEPELG